MKKLITIAAITIVSIANVKAQTVTNAKPAKNAITVISPRQAVEANGRIIVLSDSQINFLRGFKDAGINAALDSHVTIKFSEMADNIISLCDRQTPGNKENYYASFRMTNYHKNKVIIIK